MKKSRKFLKSIRGRLSIGVAIGVLLIVVLSAAVAIASIVSIQRSSSIQLVDSLQKPRQRRHRPGWRDKKQQSRNWELC